MRAELPEIERAGSRRVRELAERIKMEGLHPAAVDAALEAIAGALVEARKEKSEQ